MLCSDAKLLQIYKENCGASDLYDVISPGLNPGLFIFYPSRVSLLYSSTHLDYWK